MRAWRRRKDIFTNHQLINQLITKLFVAKPLALPRSPNKDYIHELGGYNGVHRACCCSQSTHQCSLHAFLASPHLVVASLDTIVVTPHVDTAPSRSLYFSWHESLFSSFLLDSFRGVRMRSGSSETEVLCSFLEDINAFDVFPFWILRPLWFLKLCSQWFHLNHVLKLLAQKATTMQLLGYLYSIPLDRKIMMGKPVINILKH